MEKDHQRNKNRKRITKFRNRKFFLKSRNIARKKNSKNDILKRFVFKCWIESPITYLKT